MPIYIRCSCCGRRLPAGERCPCRKRRHKEYDQYSRDKRSEQFYHSREWISARSAALEEDDGIDVYMYMTRQEIVLADTVHHIIPLKNDWSRRCDMSNLMSLHHDTHSYIEQRYKREKEKMQAELQEMLVRYREMKEGGGQKSFEKTRLTARPPFLTQISENE